MASAPEVPPELQTVHLDVPDDKPAPGAPVTPSPAVPGQSPALEPAKQQQHQHHHHHEPLVRAHGKRSIAHAPSSLEPPRDESGALDFADEFEDGSDSVVNRFLSEGKIDAMVFTVEKTHDRYVRALVDYANMESAMTIAFDNDDGPMVLAIQHGRWRLSMGPAPA